jgi:putative peptidoglycan lipid II flippase
VSKHIKNIGIVSFLTLVSRFLGLLRDSLQGALFGTGELLSAFVTANIFPNLFRRLLAEGSLTAAFVPVLQEELHQHGKSGAFGLLSKVTSWLVAVSGGVALLGMVIFSQTRWIAGLPERWYLGADLAVILFPYLAMVSVAAAFCAALNVLGRFAEPAFNPMWLNLAILASLGAVGLHLAHTPLGRIHWLCAGWLFGGFLQMAVPAGVLIREGWRPRFDLGLSPRVREIAALMTPGIIGLSIYQVNFAVSRFLAFTLDDSSATYLYMVNRLVEVPQGVFAVAVSTVVYQLVARHAAQGNHRALAEDFRKGIRFILIINIPAAAGLALLSRPIIELLFRHGKVTPGDAHRMGVLLAVMVISIPFFSVVGLTVRTFYAVKDTKTPVKIAAIDFCVNIVVTLTLVFGLGWGVVGIAIASTTAIIVQTVLLARALAGKFPDIGYAQLRPSLLKVFAGTALMAGVVGLGWRSVDRLALTPTWRDALAIFGLIPLGGAVYAAAIWLLRIEGREELAALWRRRRGRGQDENGGGLV